jgi:hypothetical protein
MRTPHLTARRHIDEKLAAWRSSSLKKHAFEAG